MAILKKVLYPLFSFFLAYKSIELVRLFNSTPPTEFSWFSQLALAVMLNLFITGIFAFMGFAYATSRILPNSYYRIKDPKTLTYLYQVFGVKYFKAFLLFAFWGREKNRKRYFDGTKSGIENFDIQTRQSEFGHLGALILITVVSFNLLVKGYLIVFALTTAINLISNLYPIILQRVHRIQIERLAKLSSQRR